MSKKMHVMLAMFVCSATTTALIVYLGLEVSNNSRRVGLATMALLGVMCAIAAFLEGTHKPMTSTVPGHEGLCVPVWLNLNSIDRWQSGAYTGFFRAARRVPVLGLYRPSGPEFQGYIKQNGTVATTEGHYSGPLPE